MSARTHRLQDLLDRTPRDKQKCAHCGAREDLTLDHIVPLSRGGSGGWDNLQLLCTLCNNRKGDSLDKMGAKGALRPELRSILAPRKNTSGRPGLHSMTLDELWAAYDDAIRERKLWRARVRLDAISREIQRRGADAVATG